MESDVRVKMLPLNLTPPFDPHNHGVWWGFKVLVPEYPEIEIWLQNVSVGRDDEIEWDRECLLDGSRLADCEDPHCDYYFEELRSEIYDYWVNSYD